MCGLSLLCGRKPSAGVKPVPSQALADCSDAVFNYLTVLL